MSDALPKWDMTHDEIAAQNIVECYLLGKLTADESARFEEHFVDCPVCLDQLEAAERFRAALKPIAGETIREVPARNTARVWRMAWPMAAAILLALGASLFFAVRDAALRRELHQVQIASLEWQHRYESAAELLRRPATPAGTLAASTFFLAITRGPDSDHSDPINRVTIPASPGLVVLSLEGEVEIGFESVRATITDAAGTPVWRLSGMPVTPRETLSLILPSSVLHPGDFVVSLEGISSSGRSADVGRYRFRASPR